MKKIKILKVCLIFIAIIIVATTLYGEWKIIKDIEEIQQKSLEPKTSLRIASKPQVIKNSYESLKYKTYRNECLGFEFDYPAEGWKLEVVNETYWRGPDLVMGIEKILKKNGEESEPKIFFDLQSVTRDYGVWEKELDPEKYVINLVDNGECCGGPEGGGRFIDYNHLNPFFYTNTGIRGIQVKGGLPLFGPLEGIVFPLPRKFTYPRSTEFLTLMIFHSPSVSEEALDVFQCIVSSFRYTEDIWEVKDLKEFEE